MGFVLLEGIHPSDSAQRINPTVTAFGKREKRKRKKEERKRVKNTKKKGSKCRSKSKRI